ncbi:MAG: protein translocase subunit SecF [Acidobacteria bacterium]|nr:protein translocase subunit SecF [Acidobacteriota bacterium]
MSTFGRMYRGETHIDFVGNRNRGFTFSAVVIGASLVSMIFFGFNVGIDFEGGTVIEMENPAGAPLSEVRDALADLGISNAKVQSRGEGVRIQTEQLSAEDEQAVVEAIAEVVGEDPDQASRQTVGPTFGRQVAESAIRALVIFLLLVAVYISIRLEWRMALSGMLALGHDLVFTAGIYSMVGFEVSPATVIAILTILGYSLYDTVVVFDKVLENIQERGDKQTISAIVNMSMNQVLMRSINTSLTSLLPIGSLLFVGSFLLGATTLREFALALFIGVFAGTYSSIFVAAPVLARWKEREERWQRVRRRVERKGDEDAFAVTHGEAGTVHQTIALRSGATPRPPKKRRKKR